VREHGREWRKPSIQMQRKICVCVCVWKEGKNLYMCVSVCVCGFVYVYERSLALLSSHTYTNTRTRTPSHQKTTTPLRQCIPSGRKKVDMRAARCEERVEKGIHPNAEKNLCMYVWVCGGGGVCVYVGMCGYRRVLIIRQRPHCGTSCNSNGSRRSPRGGTAEFDELHVWWGNLVGVEHPAGILRYSLPCMSLRGRFGRLRPPHLCHCADAKTLTKRGRIFSQ